MSQTHKVFIAIVGGTVLLIGAILAWQLFNNLVERAAGNGDAVETEEATAVPAGTVLVTLASSNTKQNWLTQVTAQFNEEGHEIASGNKIVVAVSHVTSGDSMNAILDGRSQTVAWSPGDQSWVAQANETWQQRTNRPLASQDCLPTIYAPLGFAMWRPMAEVLGWPDTAIGWDTIVALAADPDGWASYGRPEWGKFQFGHTHPAYANSGLLSMTSFVYGIAGKTETLTPREVYAPEVEQAMRLLEQNTSKYGRQAPALLEMMVREGPSYLHAAAVPEADAVRFNVERGHELTLPLAFIFPAEGTIWGDHPYCILDNAEWVTAEQAEAAALFRDYLLAREQQEAAIDNYLRPLDSSIPLRSPLDLAYGTDPRVNTSIIPELPSPSAEISAAVIDLFQITKRKTTVLLVLDVSGSMEGDRIRSARTATVEFLQRLDANDEVGVMIFSDNIQILQSPVRKGEVAETLAARIEALVANGNTALYQAVCEAVQAVEAMQAEDIANGESRLYGVVLLSDGEDTVGRTTQNQMFATCLPDNAEADGIKVFPIAFGSAADDAVLSRIARTTGGQMFTADPNSISNAYLSISAEQ